jgi:prevent-host-death family protein
MAKRVVPAGAFKQGCLALIDEVAENHDEIVITKRGTPVARLVPIEDPREHERRLLSQWRGKAKQCVSDEAFLKPSSSLVRWQATVDDENEDEQ